MRELQQQLKAAKQQAAAEETARLEAALKQAGHAPRTCHTRQMPCTRHAHSRRDRCEESGYASLAITPVHNAGEARQPGGILRDAPRVVHRGQRQGRRRILRVQALARVDGQDGVVGRSSVEKARGQSRSCACRQRSLCVSFCYFARCARSPGQLEVGCGVPWELAVARGYSALVEVRPFFIAGRVVGGLSRLCWARARVHKNTKSGLEITQTVHSAAAAVAPGPSPLSGSLSSLHADTCNSKESGALVAGRNSRAFFVKAYFTHFTTLAMRLRLTASTRPPAPSLGNCYYRRHVQNRSA